MVTLGPETPLERLGVKNVAAQIGILLYEQSNRTTAYGQVVRCIFEERFYYTIFVFYPNVSRGLP